MTAPTPWWRAATVYEVYVRSFADADGDGVGDLRGVRARLPYLSRLGVDAIWLTPFYPSPLADGGYDVADPRGVDPRFGTLADFDALVSAAHARGLRVIIDLVPNHTSIQHPWFQAALGAPPGSPQRARYIFRPGRGTDGAQPPNNWRSVFGGPAWTRVEEPDGSPGEWYLHLFAPEQPDLNWRNPEVTAEHESILRYWLDRGVDGVRIDVAMGLLKHPDLPDVTDAEAQHPTEGGFLSGGPIWGRPEVHDVYRRWRRILDRYPGQRMAVGEVWTDSHHDLARYVRPDELHQVFNFAWLLAPWSAAAFRDVIENSLAAMEPVAAPTTWVLANHDVTRTVTRYGDGPIGLARARAAALTMLALPGCAYLYQGEELGLPEVLELPDDVRQDPTWRRSGHTVLGRDGCRVPLPWSGGREPFGFSPDSARPWLPMPAAWKQLTVATQLADPDSTLCLYRGALRLRRAHPALGGGRLQWLDSRDDCLVFLRPPGLVCAVNCGSQPMGLPAHHGVLLASGPLEADLLPPDTAVWLAAPI